MAIQYACPRCHESVVSDPGMPATCARCGLAQAGGAPDFVRFAEPELDMPPCDC